MLLTIYRRYGSRTTLAMLGLFTALVLLAGTLIILMATGPAAAATTQIDAPNATDALNGTDAPNGTRIQQGVYLQDRDYDNATGTATVTLHVESPTAVTLADGAVKGEGEVPRKTEVLQPGTHTVALNVGPKVRGTVAVSIATEETLYFVPIETPDGDNQMFQGQPGWGTVRIAGVGSGLGVLVALAGEAYRRRSGGRKEVRQRA
jgi:hypothetical protein